MDIKWKDDEGRIINVFDDLIKFKDKNGSVSEYKTSELKDIVFSEGIFSIKDKNENVVIEIGVSKENNKKAKKAFNGLTGKTRSRVRKGVVLFALLSVLFAYKAIGSLDNSIDTPKEVYKLINKNLPNATILYSKSTDEVIKAKDFGSTEDLALGISNLILELKTKEITYTPTILILAENSANLIHLKYIDEYPTEYTDAEEYILKVMEVENAMHTKYDMNQDKSEDN